MTASTSPLAAARAFDARESATGTAEGRLRFDARGGGGGGCWGLIEAVGVGVEGGKKMTISPQVRVEGIAEVDVVVGEGGAGFSRRRSRRGW